MKLRIAHINLGRFYEPNRKDKLYKDKKYECFQHIGVDCDKEKTNKLHHYWSLATIDSDDLFELMREVWMMSLNCQLAGQEVQKRKLETQKKQIAKSSYNTTTFMDCSGPPLLAALTQLFAYCHDDDEFTDIAIKELWKLKNGDQTQAEAVLSLTKKHHLRLLIKQLLYLVSKRVSVIMFHHTKISFDSTVATLAGMGESLPTLPTLSLCHQMIS